MNLTTRQRREVEVALRHIGRAMRALERAEIPLPSSPDLGRGQDAYAFHDGERRLGQASDRLIDGLEAHSTEPSDG